MATDRELTALQVSGVSIKNLVLSPVIFSLAAFCLTFYVSWELVSWGSDNFRKTALEMIRDQTRISVQPGVFNQFLPGIAIFAQKTDLETGDLLNIFIRDETRKESPLTIVSPIGRIITDTEQGEIFFILENGRIYRHEKEENTVISFLEYRIRLDIFSLIGDMQLRDKDPEEMSWFELVKAKNEKEPESKSYRRIALEQHKRFSLPLACLVLGFFAVPLGMTLQGVGRNWGLFLAIMCFLVYYTIFTAGYSLGEIGIIPVFIALWIPNFVFFVLAMVVFYFYSLGREFNLIFFISNFLKKDKNAVRS